LPPPAQGEGDRYWVPAGRRVQVKRYVLPDGLVYLGSDLLSVQPTPWTLLEPSLIDPSLPILHQHPDRDGDQLPALLSYSVLPAACRAAYLDWLAGGRRDPGVSIGYVALFFYGIERRLLFDAGGSAQARAEQDTLVAEVERLVSIYGDDLGFRERVEPFVQIGRLLNRPMLLGQLQPPRVPFEPVAMLSLRMALGLHAALQEPLSAEWALAWLVSRSDAGLPAAAQRRPEEFRQLFLARYPGAFRAGGLRVSPGRERLQAYQPASPSFNLGSIQLMITEVWPAKGPIQKLKAFAARIARELESAQAPEPPIALDPRKIQEKIAETERVASLLDTIFQDEPVRPVLTADRVLAPAPTAPTPDRVPGLDAVHSALVRQLAERPAWTRGEVEHLAGSLGLLPDGALEAINEAAFEHCGSALLEGDETIEIDLAVLAEILG
jgi:hypothetical protein